MYKRQVFHIWIFNYIGNFIGAAGLSLLFVASGASHQILTEFYKSFFMDKISIHPSELILRGILCNFLVCLAVWTGTRMKSESGKILVIAGIITTFVICGFEHCIACLLYTSHWHRIPYSHGLCLPSGLFRRQDE